MYWLILMVIILQWNARSLLANGQEFKHFIRDRKINPDVVCIQETWLKPNLEFVIHGYIGIRNDRENGGGGEEEDVLHLLSKMFHIGYWKRERI